MTITFNGLYSDCSNPQVNMLKFDGNPLCFSCGYVDWKNQKFLIRHCIATTQLNMRFVSYQYQEIMKLYNFISQEKNNFRRVTGVCAASWLTIPVLELVAHPADHSPHLRCSPGLEEYQLEECRILCHRSVHQKPQTEFRLPTPPSKFGVFFKLRKKAPVHALLPT